MLTAVTYVTKPLDAARGADCLLLLTEWDEFRNIDLDAVKQLLKAPNVVDGRNVYDPAEMRARGFQYLSIGRA